MRLHGKELRLGRRLGVTTWTIIGGLAVLLMLAVVACNDAETQPTVEPTLPVPLVEAADVEVVYASRERQPPFLFPGDYDPLWGDLDADVPIIDRLLRAMADGTPVKMDEEAIEASNLSLAMNVRFRNGITWPVRQVRRCELTPEGRKTNCLPVPDHWQLLHRNDVVVSTALTEWFERAQEYMPRVEHFEILPDPISLSERFTISGGSFHEGERVELSIEFSDGSVLQLGNVSLDHGAFSWEGGIRETAPSGPAKISKRVMDGTEVVWSVTRSTAVAVPTARSTTTPPQTLFEAEYSIGELAMWYERLGDVIWGIRGIAWTDLNETEDRIDIGLYPRRGTRGELEAVLTALDIPREAIVIEDGCEGVSQWPHEVGKSFEEAFLRAFDYSLEAVSRVTYGETVRMKLTIQNATDEPVAFVLGGRPPYDFVLTTPGGEGVWFWMCGKITNSVRDGKTLEPGEKLELVGEWEQVDNRGEPVPPGTYVVRGVLTLGQTDLGPPDEVLVTETHELQVQIPTTSDSPSPTATPTPAPMPTPGQDHLEGPPQGPGVEIWTGYPYTLYVHCGIRDARFDGRLWMADPMLSDGSGNSPLDWAPGDSEGIMELVDDDLAVFTAESGRTIQFKPWPLDVEWRPCA